MSCRPRTWAGLPSLRPPHAPRALVGAEASPSSQSSGYSLTRRFPQIGNDRDEADRQLAQLFGPMGHVGIEEQGIARRQQIGAVAMAVTNLALQHVEEFD